ncbi:MAG: hypothetical protein AAGB14_13445, partial [Verrucomicrobiota bacterium]
MSKDRLIQAVALLLIIGALIASSALITDIEHQRRQLQLAADTDIGENVPPEYALLAQMGSFRGIAVNALWYRIEQMKREGDFYEANNLSRWITKLQPRFPQVWAFMGWNMAYNISVKAKTPEERWDWVNKGITLLREEGIPENPNAIRLYRELGWILFHKVGGSTDDMHHYYKAQMARIWHTRLGGHADRLPKQAYIDRYATLKKMTEDYFVSRSTGLLVGTPSSETLTRFRTDHPRAAPLLNQLQTLGHQPDLKLLNSLGTLLMYRDYYPWPVIEALDDQRL